MFVIIIMLLNLCRIQMYVGMCVFTLYSVKRNIALVKLFKTGPINH